MYKVNTLKNGQVVNSIEFATYTRAINYVIERASELSLEVSEDFTRAYSEGNKPEDELELVEL